MDPTLKVTVDLPGLDHVDPDCHRSSPSILRSPSLESASGGSRRSSSRPSTVSRSHESLESLSWRCPSVEPIHASIGSRSFRCPSTESIDSPIVHRMFVLSTTEHCKSRAQWIFTTDIDLERSPSQPWCVSILNGVDLVCLSTVDRVWGWGLDPAAA